MTRQNQSPAKLAAVLFDYGGVLAEEGFREGLKALGRRFGLDPERVYQLGRKAVYDTGYVRGEGSEIDFWQQLIAASGLPPYVPAFTDEILSRFVLRPEMITAVQCLRRHHLTVAILSDQTDWLDRLDRRDHFFGEFDAVFNSYHLGCSKEEEAIFAEVAGRLGLSGERILFVDDSQENVARARRQGLKAMLFTDPARDLGTLETFTGIPLRH